MILLDTCILLRLAAAADLPAPITDVLKIEPWAMSCLSAWEIGIKHASGKLILPQAAGSWWDRAVEVFGLQVLDFSDRDALLASALPLLHQDPFDRGLIAVALNHHLKFVTVDRMLIPYRDVCGVDFVDGTGA